MAVAPIFVGSIDQLKQSLRLSAVNGDGEQVLLDALAEVRVSIYDRLGSARVAEIKAYTDTDAPTTPDELMRSRAKTLETKWVRVLCLRRMPVLFMDSTASAEQEWNREGLTRDARGRDTQDEINRLESEIHTALELLDGSSAPPTSRVQATVIGPTCTNPAPGSFIYDL